MAKIHSIHCLKKKFEVRGSFYKNFTNGRIHTCCDLTEIRRKENHESECDAVIILSNPKQVQDEKADLLYEVNPTEMEDISMRLLKTSSDMHQFIYLMERMQWNVVRLIYLTDLLFKNEEKFAHDVLFMQKNKEDIHSIFSNKRKQHLSSVFTDKTTIIAAWGTKAILQPFAEQALQKLQKLGPVYGIKNSKKSFYYQPSILEYAHHEPWLTKVEHQLKTSKTE